RAHHADDALNDRLQRRQEPLDDIDRRANPVLDRVEEDADDNLAVLDVAADEPHHDGPNLLRPLPDRPTRLDQASNEVHEEPSDQPPEERQHSTEGTLDGVPRGSDATEDGADSFAQLTEGAAEALLRLLPHARDAGQEVLGEPVNEETDGSPHGPDGNAPRLADSTGDRLPDRDERLHQPIDRRSGALQNLVPRRLEPLPDLAGPVLDEPPRGIERPHDLVAEVPDGDADSDNGADDEQKRADTDAQSRCDCPQTGHDRLHDRGLPDGQQRKTEGRPRQAEALQRVQENGEHPAESPEQRGKETEDRTQNLEAACETDNPSEGLQNRRIVQLVANRHEQRLQLPQLLADVLQPGDERVLDPRQEV